MTSLYLSARGGKDIIPKIIASSPNAAALEKFSPITVDKLKALKSSGVTNFLYLFSDAGSLAMVYELNGK